MAQDRGSRHPPLVAMVLLAQFLTGSRGRAEDQVAYKFESYEEEAGRISIQTHSVYFDKAINSALTIKGDAVYDGISGSSPTGAPPPPGSNQVPLAKMHDERYAGNLELGIHLGNQTLAPQFSYSTENDYTSIGVALADAIEFNQKNTTLNLGVSHNFDDVHPSFWKNGKRKDSTDALIGVTQLLDPRTYLTVNGTVGYSDGYLADPYKGVRFDDYNPADPFVTFPEKRPGYKSKEILYLGLTHYFDPINASIEGSYRFYHDSFDINAQTVEVTWYQKIGKHIILAPMFRYYYQTEASFYVIRLPGDLTVAPPPQHYYSADYRLSELETFTYGGKIIYQINDHIRIDGAYKRYDMQGLDGKTSSSAYPKANVFTVGATWCF